MATPAQLSALLWLRNRGGDGVFAEKNHQVLLAQGDRAGVNRSTWNRLEAEGLVERYMKRRLRVTDYGWRKDLSGVFESDCAELIPEHARL